MKYKQRGLTIDATQYEVGMENGIGWRGGFIKRLIAFVLRQKPEYTDNSGYGFCPYINTRQGRMFINPGDYILELSGTESTVLSGFIFDKLHEPYITVPSGSRTFQSEL